MLKKITGIVALLVGTGCTDLTPVAVHQAAPSASAIASAKNAVSQQLKDPNSMQTRRLRGYKSPLGDVIVCGEYNAKNSFGAYTGFSMFYVRLRSGAVKSMWRDGDQEYFHPATAACKQAASGRLNMPSSEVPGAKNG